MDPITLIGYGSQARAWAANLRDSGRDVRVGLRPGSPREAEVRDSGFPIVDLQGPIPTALVAVLVPDEVHAHLVPALSGRVPEGGAFIFAHGFSVRFRTFPPPAGQDLILVAPKGIGPAVRQLYTEGRGVAALVGVDADSSGRAWDRARALARDLGCERAGVYESTFREECEADLFSEQAVLVGGVPALVQAAFELMVSRGISPETAYFECVHELKLITDMVVERGFAGMYQKISSTAKFGGLAAGARIVDSRVRSTLEVLLDRIQSGEFAREFQDAMKRNLPEVQAFLETIQRSPIETVGDRIRHRLAGD